MGPLLFLLDGGGTQGVSATTQTVPIRRMRQAPYIATDADGRLVRLKLFQLDLQVGLGEPRT